MCTLKPYFVTVISVCGFVSVFWENDINRSSLVDSLIWI